MPITTMKHTISAIIKVIIALNMLFKRVPFGSFRIKGVKKNIHSRIICDNWLGINLYPQSNVITKRMGQLMLISWSKESSYFLFVFW